MTREDIQNEAAETVRELDKLHGATNLSDTPTPPAGASEGPVHPIIDGLIRFGYWLLGICCFVSVLNLLRMIFQGL